MNEAILNAVVQTIVENLGSLTFEKIGSMWGVEDEFEKLKDTASAVNAVLLDAEEQQDKSNRAKHWNKKLRDAVYDADDLLTEFYTKDMRQRVMGGDETAKKVRTSITKFIKISPSIQLAFRHDMAKKITTVRERFDAIANEMNKFQLVVHPSQNRALTRERDQTCSFVCEEEVIGREEDKKAIKDGLLNFDMEENVSFMSIVGIGGMGKTTLTQYVYNDEEVKTYFELLMWVCVSDVFDVKTIAEKIIKCAIGSILENLEMEQVQNKLHETLNQKKYLLVLDDVWNEDEEKWCNLRRLLMGGSRGSKVVITTRTLLVANITSTISPYHLQGLSKNQSWSLFKQMAFKKRQEMINPNLEDIGRDIVQKCYGVPLVIKAIGRILYFKKTEDEWLYIKNKELTYVTQEENNRGILSILKLSYDHLPPHLKCCFAYCALFPKDHRILKLRLINLWIAQGFIQSSNEKLSMEDVANEYCMDLLWRSFFQEAREDSLGNIISFKMHNLIHDLAQSISGVECTYIDSNIENVNENVRHLSVASIGVLQKDLSSLVKAKKIRTFISMATKIHFPKILGEEESACLKSTLEILFSRFRCLRALDLYSLNIKMVPNSIEELTYLKYLDLSNNDFDVLPSSVIGLLNLQTLILNHCYKLKELPENIQNLFNLRNLELKGCYNLTHMPTGLGQLTSLRVLPFFIVNKEVTCGGLPVLNRLNNLSGELSITIKVRVKDAASKAKAANLEDKQHLKILELIWDDELGNDVAVVCEDENLIEGLQPHQNLKILNVRGYQSVRFPSWLPSLTGLVIIEISKSMWQHLSPMYRLPNLRNLSIEEMFGLEYISDREITEEISASSKFFPSLESLKLRTCPNLKGWWRRDTVVVTTSSHQYQPHVSLPSFPRLLQLVIRDCENLTCMPLFPNLEIFNCSSLKSLSEGIGNLAALQNLEIGDCPNLISLPEGIGNLTALHNLGIGDCPNLKSPSEGIGNLTALQSLKIFKCPNLISLSEGIGNLTALQSLEILFCTNLKSLPKGIGSLTSLKRFEVRSCHNLTSLPSGMHRLSSLQTLIIIDCPHLKERYQKGIGEIAHVPDFQYLDY